MWERVAARGACLAVIGAFVIAGCSGGSSKGKPQLYRASGKLTYNGQPVPGAKVMFLGDGKAVPAVGVTDSEGNFTLSSLAGSGAAAGKHLVAISKNTDAEKPANVNVSMEEAAKAAQNPPKESTEASLVPKKYTNAATSGLEFEVTPNGKNYFEIDLKD